MLYKFSSTKLSIYLIKLIVDCKERRLFSCNELKKNLILNFDKTKKLKND